MVNEVPLICGVGFTVTSMVAMQPSAPHVIVAVPAVIPVTTPVAAPTVATPGLLLLHGPAVVASLSVVVAPWHIVGVPNMAEGNGVTVTVANAVQPAGVV